MKQYLRLLSYLNPYRFRLGAAFLCALLVAGGIKVALLTTVFGLIVAIILQIFYNYLLSRIDRIPGQMEEASIGLVDLLIKNNKH